MNRLHVPSIETSPAASVPLLEAVKKQLGVVPNFMRLVSNSTAAFEGYLQLSGALSNGKLGAKTGERIALAVAEFNRCNYCLSAHSYLATQVAKLEQMEVTANRKGDSSDAKARAAIQFAFAVADTRGHVSDESLGKVKAAGFDDAEIIEIVAHVALNTFTNYVNSVAQTEIDFPVVKAF